MVHIYTYAYQLLCMVTWIRNIATHHWYWYNRISTGITLVISSHLHTSLWTPPQAAGGEEGHNGRHIESQQGNFCIVSHLCPGQLPQGSSPAPNKWKKVKSAEQYKDMYVWKYKPVSTQQFGKINCWKF